MAKMIKTMSKTGIFYATTGGNTARVAKEIATRLGVGDKDIHDVAHTAPSAVGDYDVLIFGSPTSVAGDMQGDMETFVDAVSSLDLRDKMVAIFGLGDVNMTDSFCNAVGEIYHRLHDSHPMFFAPFDNSDYKYNHSDADVHGMTVGLCLDDDNYPELTPIRLDAWCEKIKEETV